jgi:Spy/CpxP family protein refolding chaperone
MRKFVVAAAAAVIVSAATFAMTGAPAAADPLRLAQADVSVRIGDGPRYHHRDRMRHRDGMYRRGWHAGCRTVTIKERRGNRVIIKKIRRC